MNTTTFVRGVCVGMVTGAVVDMIVHPKANSRKTTVGKAMQRMGNAMDSAMDSINCMMK